LVARSVEQREGRSAARRARAASLVLAVSEVALETASMHNKLHSVQMSSTLLAHCAPRTTTRRPVEAMALGLRGMGSSEAPLAAVLTVQLVLKATRERSAVP
jgi:hypothetical protein